MKALLTAFKGTSTEKLIKCFDKSYGQLVLENDKRKSEYQLKECLFAENYAYILSFGQRPVMKNKITIEKCARYSDKVKYTSFDCGTLVQTFEEFGITAKLSENAGTSFCNNIYWFGLDYLSKSDTRMVFIHIPCEKNISDFNSFADGIKNALSKIFDV